jgi:hypothetical protein
MTRLARLIKPWLRAKEAYGTERSFDEIVGKYFRNKICKQHPARSECCSGGAWGEGKRRVESLKRESGCAKRALRERGEVLIRTP